MIAFARRLLCDEDGQDLVEYALLTGAIGFAAVVVFDVLLSAIGNTYGSQVSSTNSLWESPAPSGGS